MEKLDRILSIYKENRVKVEEIAKFVEEEFKTLPESFKAQIFSLILSRVFSGEIVPPRTEASLGIKEEKKVSEKLSFPEYVNKYFIVDQLNTFEKRLLTLLLYHKEIHYRPIIDEDLREVIKEFFPYMGWPIPKNLNRDIRYVIRKGRIVCNDAKMFKQCYITDLGIKFIRQFLKKP